LSWKVQEGGRGENRRQRWYGKGRKLVSSEKLDQRREKKREGTDVEGMKRKGGRSE